MENNYRLDIEKIIGDVKILNKIYHNIRIVDPVRKKLLYYKDDEIVEADGFCYGLWSQNKLCSNCISMRAYNEKDVFIKIECTGEKTYMITAIPIEVNEGFVIIELLRDVTDNFVFENPRHQSMSISAQNMEVVKDSLTQVYNRRYINERLPAEMANCHLTCQPLSIIMADLDYFKKVNDNFGHVAGDFVLKEFAKRLKGCLTGERDWVARYGGEEFLVFLSNSTTQQAKKIAENMRRLVEQRGFIYNNQLIKVTSSFGVCTMDENSQYTLEKFIECADKKLYQAKQQGRNQVQG